MKSLELRVPPVVVALVIAAGMWLARLLAPKLALGLSLPLLPPSATIAAMAFAGIAIALAGVVEFRRAHTTVDPTNPGKSTAVVSTGIYRRTRNPMYLGFLLLLVAWAVWLANAIAYAGPIVFWLYMNRFQIAPEERILRERFGAPYEAYLQSVRRWF
jgi:protein-S-isoprenylcysteine O-methyltransferase Ste14